MGELEGYDRDLLEVKDSRLRMEYYFTCTSAFLIYVLNRFGEIDIITYLDSDLYFYSSIKPVFEEMGKSSVLIIPHRYPLCAQESEKYGLYNVGWLSFKKNDQGLTVLKWWRERCLEWCYDRIENGKFADQKYLDCWPEKFKGVHVLQNEGANLAPWNVENYIIRKREKIEVGDKALMFYHFQSFKLMGRRFVHHGLSPDTSKWMNNIILFIYLPYVRAFLSANRLCRGTLGADFGLKGQCREGLRESQEVSLLFKIRQFLEKRLILCMFGAGFYWFGPSFEKLFYLYDKVRGR
ncbi:hypothetical protein ACFLS1_03705 [Verrucomicrobiota bacterium]